MSGMSGGIEGLAGTHIVGSHAREEQAGKWRRRRRNAASFNPFHSIQVS